MIRYVDDSIPGITRKRQGRYWQYFAPDGSRITDREEIDRLNGVGMPPAYERCWFCPLPDGHIQAVGWDARGRKQYRYHPAFREQQESRKYERLAHFGRALPKLRKRVETDLAGKPTAKETVLAAVVRLIDETRMRVGNEEYAKENKSFGATTLRNRHARVQGTKLKLTYAGKHGIKRTVTVNDRNLARIAKRTQDLPGQHLFEYHNDEGEVCPVTSSDVNAYIKEAMGDDFTAKDFRTWSGTVLAARALAGVAGFASQREAKRKVVNAIESVARSLGNTKTVCRKSYVHPAVIDAYMEGATIRVGKPRALRAVASTGLSPEERAVVALVSARLRRKTA